MRLAVIGATGGIGRHLYAQAVAAGHEVTAVVRDPRRLPRPHGPVSTVDLSAADPATLAGAFAGCDAVLSGLGARSVEETGIALRGTRAVVDAMRVAGVRRIVVVSAASVGTVASPGRPDPPRHNPGDGFVLRHTAARLAKLFFRRYYADLALMEDLLRDSDLDWTVSRPPRLLDRPLTGRYRVVEEWNVRGGLFIGRADVAHHMLSTVDNPEAFRKVYGIAYDGAVESLRRWAGVGGRR
ncbi:NADH-flavin reductase [Virgisporangium aliadipatigenens]|uniref:NADH-flavin reductase n=1 Tax=Virgisporangium aliadipatigenens TaxID=741659 RepID=A0A8J4DNC6_9ACTN|nr:NAD(P)H-binding protein [Virgisporangium aliadipatigenens]GIJ43392.1 NADH-flavin reductase [Virgisporangium aliadipatigenens]